MTRATTPASRSAPPAGSSRGPDARAPQRATSLSQHRSGHPRRFRDLPGARALQPRPGMRGVGVCVVAAVVVLARPAAAEPGLAVETRLSLATVYDDPVDDEGRLFPFDGESLG